MYDIHIQYEPSDNYYNKDSMWIIIKIEQQNLSFSKLNKIIDIIQEELLR